MIKYDEIHGETKTRCTGTGGTIAGAGTFLKHMDEKILVVLADPQGSGLYNKVLCCCIFHHEPHKLMDRLVCLTDQARCDV